MSNPRELLLYLSFEMIMNDECRSAHIIYKHLHRFQKQIKTTHFIPLSSKLLFFDKLLQNMERTDTISFQDVNQNSFVHCCSLHLFFVFKKHFHKICVIKNIKIIIFTENVFLISLNVLYMPQIGGAKTIPRVPTPFVNVMFVMI